MDRRPVKAYATPAYPTRADLGPDSSLLRDNLPAAWRRLDAVMPGVIVLLVAAATSGCPSARDPSSSVPPERIGSTGPIDSSSAPSTVSPGSPGASGESGPVTVDVPTPPSAAEQLPAAATGPIAPGEPDAMVVAPLFEHGEGRGAVGCVVVAPPVFLSEQEALSIVREELARQGIALGGRSLALPEVSIAEQRILYETSPTGELSRRSAPVDGTERTLELDALAAKQHVAVEVVSRESYFELGGEHSGSSVQGFDLKGVASSLVERLRKDGKRPLYVGVFYDPVGTLDLRSLPRPPQAESYEAARDALRRKSAEQLRDQVRDFASWLRGKAVL